MKSVFYNSIHYEEPVIIIVGQNGQDNWDILDASKNENGYFWWFHLKSFPSSHVIVKVEKMTKELLVYAAELCKNSTKYKNLKKIYVNYTQCNNVIKDGPIGSVCFKSNRKIKSIMV
tara:strand:- start:274 stop:624 length:351 start_codon:yes stop_codon:yes gene_type:complete